MKLLEGDLFGKDAFGHDLQVGDEVAFVEPYSHYLETGIVHKLNPTGATISWSNPNNYKFMGYVNNKPKYEKVTETIRTPRRYNQICKK